MLILPMKRFASGYVIKEFIFSIVVGCRLPVLLIMISFSLIFQGIWFKVACMVNIKLFFWTDFIVI